MKLHGEHFLVPAGLTLARLARHTFFALIFSAVTLPLFADDADPAYVAWIKPWTEQPATSAAMGGVGLKLIVSCVEGETNAAAASAMSPKDRLILAYHLRVSTTEVSTNGECRSYVVSNTAARTSTLRHMTPGDWGMLDPMLSQIPPDNGQLPPPGQRVIIQIWQGDHWQVFVYDGNHLPTEVANVLTVLARPYDKLF
jgi:hypothetical protein